MGWMNDTLKFFKYAPWERCHHYHDLTFSMMYFYNELYIMSFSHDEVVHGKATIMQKMWGDYENKFAQGRLLYTYMYTHPGKKLDFMGNEIGHLREWDETKEQDWFLLKYPNHDSFREYRKALHKLYVENPAMHDGEYDSRNFRWLQVHGEQDCVYVYQRTAGKHSVVIALNMQDVPHNGYTFEVPDEMILTEVLNSDENRFGGSTPASDKPKVYKTADKKLTLDLPAFGAVMYETEIIKEKEKEKDKKKETGRKRAAKSSAKSTTGSTGRKTGEKKTAEKKTTEKKAAEKKSAAKKTTARKTGEKKTTTKKKSTKKKEES